MPTGYKVVRLRMRDNRPVASEDFISGWLRGRTVWGQPLVVAMGRMYDAPFLKAGEAS